MKLACADFTFPLLTHEKSLELIALLEFDGVDIGLFDQRSHLWPSKEFVDLKKNATLLKSRLANTGLQCADVFLQCAPDFEPYAINQPDKARAVQASEWFKHTLEYASVIGSNHVTILPGVEFPEVEDYETSYQRACEQLAWRIDEARKANITLSVEAHIGSLIPTPEQTLKLVQNTPGLTLTLDYTHFIRVGMPDKRVEPLCKYASHFHTRGACRGRLQAPFKDNTIEYKRVLNKLQEYNYAGWLGIEYVWIDWEHCNECDNISETILFRDFILKNKQ